MGTIRGTNKSVSRQIQGKLEANRKPPKDEVLCQPITPVAEQRRKQRNTMLRRAREPPLITGTKIHVFENHCLVPTTIPATMASFLSVLKNCQNTIQRPLRRRKNGFWANSTDCTCCDKAIEARQRSRSRLIMCLHIPQRYSSRGKFPCVPRAPLEAAPPLQFDIDVSKLPPTRGRNRTHRRRSVGTSAYPLATGSTFGNENEQSTALSLGLDASFFS